MTKGVGGSTAERELQGLGSWPDKAAPISAGERAMRIETARRLMAEQGVDAMLVGAGTSLRYFTGAPWGPTERLVAMVLGRSGPPVIVCPVFELGSLDAVLGIEAEVRGWQEDENPQALVADTLRQMGATRLAFDPALSFLVYDRLRAVAPSADLVSAAPIIDGCRRVKSEAELALMRQAKAMTLEVQRRAAAMLAPGVTTTEVKRFIDDAHRMLGADNGSSFVAVQFARATAYPHGLPGVQMLEEGDLVLIDTGCLVQGYNSDITRTYVFGQPDADQRRVWEVEREAQQAAFDAVRPGVACEAIDTVARSVLEKAGFGPDYHLPGLPHRTGHGIGLSIHEAPYLVRGDRTPLAPGMCFSNEPMIVIPDRFGVRLEDHFHVTETGAAWFTEPSPSIDQPFG
jgi:Xaa-Pro dipeptidase